MATSHSSSTLVRALQVTGALLFIASLAMGGKAYVQAFALHHSVLARTRIKQWIHARAGIDGERALYVILASLLFFACTQLWMPLPGTWYALTGAWWWVGAAVQAAGVLVTLLAARTLSLKELMGLDPSRQAAPRDDVPALETRGLYRIVRHPIYFGWVLFVGGAPLMTSTRLLFAALSVAYLVVAIPLEERSLIESFGEPYRAYRRHVRWRMLPGIY